MYVFTALEIFEAFMTQHQMEIPNYLHLIHGLPSESFHAAKCEMRYGFLHLHTYKFKLTMSNAVVGSLFQLYLSPYYAYYGELITNH